ncbi:hypothetical protein AB1Y20_003979 [Prymnesium parvum]|uniref:glycerol kinase n=1 Tax=Prymnesium parvum TaxID=97485 RepID=A0AB34J653_PRYPA
MLALLLASPSLPYLPPPRAPRLASPPRSRVLLAAPPSDLYLGIDCGTQGTKAVLYDAQSRRVVGVGAVPYGLLPKAHGAPPGRAEQAPSVWVDALFAATDDALAAACGACGGDRAAIGGAVRAIGVSGQQHGLVALDEEYRVIRPAKLWCDTESAPEAEELATKLGWGIVASFTSTKLLWMKRNEPEEFERVAHVALPHDYLNYILTGSLVMECGDASGTGLLDTTARKWDEAAAQMIDAQLIHKLPPLIGPTERAGVLLPEVAAKLGLTPGIPVSAGGGDNMMSALGCGCTTLGRVAISLGTSGTMFAKAFRAARDATGAVCPFLDATGGGLPLLCTLNCASVPEEVRAAYGLSRDEITALAEAEPIGCEGLTFVPYLVGERTPNWPHASGALVGLRAGHLSRPGLLYRAALEGATFSLLAGLRAMQERGVPADCAEVRLVGGGSKSPLWRRIIADSFQMRVACPAEPESAGLGAALQAAAHVAGADDIGEWISSRHDAPVKLSVEPNAAVKEAYKAALAVYEKRAVALFG